MMMIISLLILLFTSVCSQQTCFDDSVCVDLRQSAPSSLRQSFATVCLAAPLWRAIDCNLYLNGTARILNATNDPFLPDLTAVFIYSRGGALWTDAANQIMRQQQGKNIPHQWRDSLVLTGSGIHQISLQNPGRSIVFRGEPNYGSAPCQYGNGMPAQELLNQSMYVSGFTATSTSLPFVLQWPFGAYSPRVLALYRMNPKGDGGAYLDYLESPYQYEVTLPPPVNMHLLACDRRVVQGRPVAVMSAIVDVVTAPTPSPATKAAVLSKLRSAFDNGIDECDERWCRFSCGIQVPPTSCHCNAAGQCTSQGLSGKMRLLNTDWVLGFGLFSSPTCMTNLDSIGGHPGDAIGFAACTPALLDRQSFLFQSAPGGTTIRYQNSSGLCISQFGAKYYSGAEARLWQCNGFQDQAFQFDHGYNEMRLINYRPNPPSLKLCLNYVALDVIAQWKTCDTGGQFEIFNAVPIEA